MAAEIRMHDRTIVVEAAGGSMASTQATGQPENEPRRNKIMYQTAAELLARRGVRFRLTIFALVIIYIFAYCYILAQQKRKKPYNHDSSRSDEDWKISFAEWSWFYFVPALVYLLVNTLTIFLILPRLEGYFLLRKKMLYFMHGLSIEVSNVIFFGVALLVWFLLLQPAEQRPGAEKSADFFVLHLIISLFVGSTLWLIQSTLLLILASSFCFDSFFDRAVESLAHEYIITVLDGTTTAPGSASPSCACLACSDKPAKIDIGELMKVPGEEFPLYTKQLLVEAISDSVNWTFQENSPIFMNEEEGKREKAAIKIFEKHAGSNRYIEIDNLQRHECLSEDILNRMLPMLEVDKDGHITLDSFKAWMDEAYDFRMVLKYAVANNKMLFKRLEIASAVLLICSIILLWLVLRKIVQLKTMVYILPQIAAGAFIFGESTKKAFEGAVYIFAVHHFDVGDSCVIGGIPMTIEHMGILTTTVRKFDKQLMYYPNAALATLPVSNYTRNPYMGDSLEFFIHLMTPDVKIERLKDEIRRYFEINKHHWQPEYSLDMKEIDASDKLKMVLSFTHTINFREFAVRDKRKFVLIMELRKIFKELELKKEVDIS